MMKIFLSMPLPSWVDTARETYERHRPGGSWCVIWPGHLRTWNPLFSAGGGLPVGPVFMNTSFLVFSESSLPFIGQVLDISY